MRELSTWKNEVPNPFEKFHQRGKKIASDELPCKDFCFRSFQIPMTKSDIFSTNNNFVSTNGDLVSTSYDLFSHLGDSCFSIAKENSVRASVFRAGSLEFRRRILFRNPSLRMAEKRRAHLFLI
jgi:hypothetical protein